MRITRRRALEVAIVSAAASTGLSACGGKKKADDPSEGLSPWEGELRELFDDQIHPAAVGMSMDSQSPARDPLLRLRVSNADVAARVQVQTVTRGTVGAKKKFSVGVRLVPPPFIEPKLEEPSFELIIRQDSAAFSLVQNLENELQKNQQKFIAFIRKFTGDDGPVLHWHLTADNEEVVEVVQEVAVFEHAGKEEKE